MEIFRGEYERKTRRYLFDLHIEGEDRLESEDGHSSEVGRKETPTGDWYVDTPGVTILED